MDKHRTKLNEVKGAAAEGPLRRQLKLPGVLVSTHGHLMQLCIESGLATLAAMLEDDRTRLCGPRYQPQAERTAYRMGTCPGQVVLGGRKIRVQRPRARSVENEELALPSWEQMTREDPLEERVMAQILGGVSTRAYPTTLEPLPEGRRSRATSRSSVSRRFVAGTKREVDRLLTRSLEGQDFPVVMLDGIAFGDHVLIVALGIDREGKKQVLGVVEGSTESEAVCAALLRGLIERGLAVERARLFVIDGGKGLRKAVRTLFGNWALIQRCQVHKMRNVLAHLPKGKQAWVKATLRRAYYASEKAASARRKLLDLAARLDEEHPGAAASIREGLDETLTILDLGVSETLARTLRSTNPIENLQSALRRVSRNVKRWRGGRMAMRWGASGVLAAEKKFRRIKGHQNMPVLIAALEARVASTDASSEARLG